MIIVDLTWLLGEINNPDDPVEKQEDEPTDDKHKLENATQEDLVKETRKLRNEAKQHRLDAQKAKQEAETLRKQIEDANKQTELAKLTEIEKEKALREEALRAKEEAERKATEAVEFVENMLRQSEIEKVANELGFRNPKLAISLYGDIKDIQISDGKVADVDKIKETLNQILEKETYLKKTEDGIKPKSPEQQKEPITPKNPASNDNDDELKKQQEEAMKRGDGTRALGYFLKRQNMLPKEK